MEVSKTYMFLHLQCRVCGEDGHGIHVYKQECYQGEGHKSQGRPPYHTFFFVLKLSPEG